MANTKKVRVLVGLWRTWDGSQELRLYNTNGLNVASPQFCWEAGTIVPMAPRAIADTTDLIADSVQDALVKGRNLLLVDRVLPCKTVTKGYVSEKVVQIYPRLTDEDRCVLLQPLIGRARLVRPTFPEKVQQVEVVS